MNVLWHLTVQEFPCNTPLLHIFANLTHHPWQEVALNIWKSDLDTVILRFKNNNFAVWKSVADLFQWGQKSIRLFARS